MPTLEQPQQCSGCFACAAACSRHAIAVGKDAEGFAVPVIDEMLCVECGACEIACAGRLSHLQKPRAAFAFAATSAEVLGSSASGGAFACLATWWLGHDGVVFAVAEEDGRAAFREVCSKDRWRSAWGRNTIRHRLTVPASKGFANCLVRVLGCCSPARRVRLRLFRRAFRKGIAAACCLSIWYARERHHTIRLRLIAKKLHANTVRSL